MSISQPLSGRGKKRKVFESVHHLNSREVWESDDSDNNICCNHCVFVALLRYNLHKTVCNFKVYNVMILYVYMLQNDNNTVKVKIVNISITPHSYKLCVVRTSKVHSLNICQIHSTVMLTMATMFYIEFPEVIHLLPGSVVAFDYLHPFPITALLLSFTFSSLLFPDTP